MPNSGLGRYRAIGFVAAAGCAVWFLMPAGTTGANAEVTMRVGAAQGSPGRTVEAEATLSTGGELVAGTQNEIGFQPETVIAAKANGKPDCEVNPDIDKSGTTFSFLPSDCQAGVSCTGVRAFVLALGNVDPIPDDSVLYTCQVAISPQAVPGAYPLVCSNAIATDPEALILATDCEDGAVNVVTTPQAEILIGSATGSPGDLVEFSVGLNLPATAEVAGTQNEIGFQPETMIAAKGNGEPDCEVNPDIDKVATSFSYVPDGCQAGVDCTGVRAFVLALGNVDPIPDDSVLYTCRVTISPQAVPGTYPLVCSGAGASDPAAQSLVTDCYDGAINTVAAPACTGDANGDGEVNIEELIQAVNNALYGCPR